MASCCFEYKLVARVSEQDTVH